MSRWGCLLLVAVAGTQVAQASTYTQQPHRSAALHDLESSEVAIATAISTELVPTVSVPQTKPVTVPTVVLPLPTATSTPKPKATATARPRKPVKRQHHRKHPQTSQIQQPKQQWITAYLTSYCPGSAGGISSSGLPVFFGMLANNFYPFGTHVYIPVIGITGVVEDHLGGFPTWYHFDVWSPVCYSTPTGFFKVAVQG